MTHEAVTQEAVTYEASTHKAIAREDCALRDGLASEDHRADSYLPAEAVASWDGDEIWGRSLSGSALPVSARGWAMDPGGPRPMGAAQDARRQAFVTATRRFRCDPNPERFEAALRRLFPPRPRKA